jgi:hypothetical protein
MSSSPLFSKRHYDALARVLVNSSIRASVTHETVCRELADRLAIDNARFDRKMFYAACGVGYLADVKGAQS